MFPKSIVPRRFNTASFSAESSCSTAAAACTTRKFSRSSSFAGVVVVSVAVLDVEVAEVLVVVV